MRDVSGRGAGSSLPGFCFAVLLSAVLACAGPGSGGPGSQDPGSEGPSDPRDITEEQAAAPSEEHLIPDTTIIAAQEELTPSVMALPGVVGTAVGLCDDVPCIKVYIARRDEELQAQIPDMYRGFKVDVEVSGEFEALDEAP